jgi:hypothetical protein
MHDLGKVILAANFDEQYHGAHTVARKQQVPLWEVEKDMFGASHGEIGAYLLGLWGMSQEVIRVAALHHHPIRSEDKTFTALTAVHVANALEYEGSPATDELPLPQVDAIYVQHLGLEARVESWRNVQRDPEAAMFETRFLRAKSPAKAGAKSTKPLPAPAQSAPAPAPKINKFAPAPMPAGPLVWRSVSKWLGLGLGVSAVLALLSWLEIVRLEHATEKPEVQVVVEHIAAPVKHEAAQIAAPVRVVQETKPAPTPVPPPNLATLLAVQPVPAPAATPAPPPTPAPAPVAIAPHEESALDRLKLEAIFFSAQHPSALINGQLARVNQLVAECRVLDISRSAVVVEYQHQRRTLNLQ